MLPYRWLIVKVRLRFRYKKREFKGGTWNQSIWPSLHKIKQPETHRRADGQLDYGYQLGPMQIAGNIKMILLCFKEYKYHHNKVLKKLTSVVCQTKKHEVITHRVRLGVRSSSIPSPCSQNVDVSLGKILAQVVPDGMASGVWMCMHVSFHRASVTALHE